MKTIHDMSVDTRFQFTFLSSLMQQQVLPAVNNSNFKMDAICTSMTEMKLDMASMHQKNELSYEEFLLQQSNTDNAFDTIDATCVRRTTTVVHRVSTMRKHI